MPMGMFNGTLCFCVGFKYDELIEMFKKKKAVGWDIALRDDRKLISEAFAVAMGRTLENQKTGKKIQYYYLYLRDCFDFSDYSYCVLAHEILHICQFFLPEVLDRNKEHEAEAYLHTWLMRECLKVIRGQK